MGLCDTMHVHAGLRQLSGGRVVSAASGAAAASPPPPPPAKTTSRGRTIEVPAKLESR
jgi:hypothetical protein